MSYTIVTDELDSLMAEYDIPATHDTIDVCNSWTGGDYATGAAITGSSENAVAIPDTVQGVLYSSGNVTAVAADGGPAEVPLNAAPTMFDLVDADSAQRQASFDAPYYGVYSGPDTGGDGSGGGGENPGDQEVGLRASGAGAAAIGGFAASLRRMKSALAGSAAVKPDTGKHFLKHGVRRRGVRALVDDAEEIAKSPEGHRRFRKVKDDVETVPTLDAGTELLIGEETREPGRTLKARHEWKKAGNGWVRRRTQVDDEEEIDGIRRHNRSVIELRNVRVSGIAVDPAAP